MSESVITGSVENATIDIIIGEGKYVEEEAKPIYKLIMFEDDEVMGVLSEVYPIFNDADLYQ